MPVINFKELKNYLAGLDYADGKNPFAPVYLIWGEEVLYKEAAAALLNAMIPDLTKSLNYEPVYGANTDVYEVIERVNTFSISSGIKVVAFYDSGLFDTKEDVKCMFEKIKEAADKDNIKDAAKLLTRLLGILSLTFEDISKEKRSKNLKFDLNGLIKGKWLDELIDFCIDSHLVIPSGEDNAGIIQKTVEKGFPENNHLIITESTADKKRGLYKAINKKGIIIDCFVPKGNRKSDQMAQAAVLKERMRQILSQNNKRMGSGAFSAAYEMTGFDIAAFSDNLEKLVSYIGDREEITVHDVESVLKRSKKDPVYEFTNAVSDRNLENSIFFLNSLLSDGFYPLQILAAITNQIRKLLIIKDFTESPYGNLWRSGISYNYFQTSILPAIQSYDELILKQLENWDKMTSGNTCTSDMENKRAKKKSGPVSDVLIAKNPGNPYPIYKMLLKSENFTKDDLFYAFNIIEQADLRLKSSSHNPKLLMEEVIFQICK